MRLPHRPLLNLYSDKSSLVLRALLREPAKKWTTANLMKEGLSAGQVVNVIKYLETTDFVERNVEWRNHYVQLANPKALLDDWAQTYNFHWNWQAWYSTEKPDFLRQLCRYLKEKKIPYALTMISGSRLVAPYVVQNVEHVYIGGVRKEFEKTLRGIEKRFFLKYPERSGNICVAAPFYKSSVFRDARVIDGYPVVSHLQLYLDLVGFPVTGADQADWLKKQLAEKGTPLIGGR
jgi:hypothetical protein